MSARALLAVAVLGLAACPEPYPPANEVGTGTEFEPIAPGAQVRMVCGPQGGQHIWVSVRVRGMYPENAAFDSAITRGGVKLCETQLSELDFRAAGDGWYAFGGVACMIATPGEVDGSEVTLTGTVRDLDGLSQTASATFIARAPPANCGF